MQLFIFFTRDPADLFLFSFLALFSFFILGGLNNEHQDERLKSNSRRAGMIGFGIAVGAVFIIGFFYANYPLPKEFVVGGCALAWDASFLTYAILLRHYERA